jgi:endoglucanase
MRFYLLGLSSLVLFAQNISAQSAQTAAVIQPTACITPQFSSSGDQYWKNITLKLTNNCSTTIDFENTTLSFKNKTALNTNFWGDFSPLPYPDNSLNIVSLQQSDGTYLATLNMHFPTNQGMSTKLPIGKFIKINYGTNSDTHIDGTTNVYVKTPVDTTGSIVLKNASPQPSGVMQNYALVHVTMNGQKINDVQLPWNASLTLSNLAPGTYNLSTDAVSNSSGNNYQGTASPTAVSVTAKQQTSATITYTLVQQTGKVAINLQTLPNELVGYTAKPMVGVTDNQSGSSVSQTLNWNSTSTVSQLKVGSTYKFSTAAISSGGYNCTPTFNPIQLIAANTAPTTKLNYSCIQVAQNSVSLNVTGAPATLTSLKVTLTPNNNSAPVSTTISLTNGSGTNTVNLANGVMYTLSSSEVVGYTVKFTPQPLTATASASVTIALSQQNQGSPRAVNGQLTVCGTKLCNAQGSPIQLKGMSSHGLQWFSNCMTSASLNALTKQFKANVVRIALYVQEGGYETNPTKFTQQVNDLINQASNLGIYVIVDWHILSPGDPNYNLDRAKKFFTDVVTANKNRNNIIYEIANEPNGVNWATIKNYADQIIPVIRAIDPKAPIIVGTRGWSSLGVSDGSSYQEMVNNPIQFPNIMYAFHFYAASHKDDYLSALDKASNVLPVFVTEFGTQTYTGDGTNDFVMSDKYMQLMANKKIGWANWNYSDDFRSGAIWTSNTCSQNVWTDDHLKPAGIYIKNKIINP